MTCVLLCYRTRATPYGDRECIGDVEQTIWDTTQEARQADAELSPCGPHCRRDHSLAYTDQRGRLRVRRLSKPELQPTTERIRK